MVIYTEKGNNYNTNGIVAPRIFKLINTAINRYISNTIWLQKDLQRNFDHDS